jgi:cytochrome c556
MTQTITKLSRALCLLAALAAVPAFAATPLDIIHDRQANQKRVGDIMRALHQALEQKVAVNTLVPLTDELAARAHRLQTLFPEGTETGGNTKARPEIWSDRAGFIQAATAYEQAADKLDIMAKAADNAGFAGQFMAVGGTCGAFHRGYRNR